VAFPAYKYELDKLPKIEIYSPQFKMSLQLKGDLTVQKKGSLIDVELTKDNATAKFKAETENALTKIAANARVKYVPGQPVELKCDLAVAAKIHGEVFATSRYSVVPPSTLRYVYEPRPIEGTQENFVFKGTFGYALEITPQQALPPIRTPSVYPVQVDKWVAIGLLIGATALVAGTLVEDVLTGGLGVADDPISFGTAAAMIGRALPAL
jgi:hypothetical protein